MVAWSALAACLLAVAACLVIFGFVGIWHIPSHDIAQGSPQQFPMLLPGGVWPTNTSIPVVPWEDDQPPQPVTVPFNKSFRVRGPACRVLSGSCCWSETVPKVVVALGSLGAWCTAVQLVHVHKP